MSREYRLASDNGHEAFDFPSFALALSVIGILFWFGLIATGGIDLYRVFWTLGLI